MGELDVLHGQIVCSHQAPGIKLFYTEIIDKEMIILQD